MAESLISIIIPAYNAAEKIQNTVESIVKQIEKPDKIEILIIENGSIDKTTEVVEALQERYSIVKVFHSKKGVSNARNLGIEKAKGSWLVFMDADDELLDGAVDILIQDACENRSDIYFYGHKNGEELRSVCDNNQEKNYEKEQIRTCEIMMLSNPTRYLQVWAKLIRKELVTANQIEFHTKMRLAEDSDFMLKCLEKASNVSICKENIYHYIISSGSAIRTFDGNKIHDYIYSMRETQKALVLSTNELKKAYAKYIMLHFNIAMVRETFDKANPAPFFHKVKQMESAFRNPLFKNAVAVIPAKECISVRMLAILCMKWHISIGAAVIYCLRAKQNRIREKI